ncbi:MAG TPA: putative metal-dependent hydrolase [Gemmatimonas sp.]|nr:putative metal-dependent hydrolase [Gemmatimonas sp.]
MTTTHETAARDTDPSETLKYPIGRFRRAEQYSVAERDASIARLAALPSLMQAAVAGIDEVAMDTPYRPGGWTVRQLVHHVADSHLNLYLRVKLALTEDRPTVKTYDQDAWVDLADITAVSPQVSLVMLDATHKRLNAVLTATPPSDFSRELLHPDNGLMRIDDVVALYAWHGDHHLAHIRGARERHGF